jgi:hypothetical protein
LGSSGNSEAAEQQGKQKLKLVDRKLVFSAYTLGEYFGLA